MSLYRPLKALLTVAAKKDIRYYLNGVHIKYIPERNVYQLEASDGHRGARIEILGNVDYINVPTKDLPHEAIIPREMVTDLVRGCNDKTRISLSYDRENLLFNKAGVSMSAHSIDGRYPDLDRIIPKTSRTASVQDGFGVRATYLADIGAFINALRSSVNSECLMRFGTPTDASLIEIAYSSNSDYVDILYLLMPARVEIKNKVRSAA